MAKIIAISEYENRLIVTVDTDQIDVIKATARDSMGAACDFKEMKSDTFAISMKDMCRQLYEQSTDIALIRSMRGRGFEYKQLAMFLLGAECDVVATRHEENSIVDDYTYKHDGYSYELQNLKFSEHAKEVISSASKRFYSVDNLFD